MIALVFQQSGHAQRRGVSARSHPRLPPQASRLPYPRLLHWVWISKR